MAQTFDVSLDRLGAVSKELSEALKSQRATEKEIRQTLLLLEEITVKFSMCMPDAPVTAEISRRYGTLRVRLSAVGEEHNPILETQDWAAGSEDYYRTLILRAHKQLLSYQRVEGRNVVTIQVHTDEKKYVRRSLIALIGGLVLGLLLYDIAPEAAAQWIDRNIFSLIQEIFMNAMAIMVVPAVFCAVVDNITSLSSLSDAGRMGGRAIRLYSLTTVVAIAVGFVIAVPVFGHLVPEATALGEADSVLFENPNLREFILSIVPQNLVEPIIGSNMVQVLFLAVVAGIAVGILGDKAEPLRKLIGALDQLFQTAIALIALVVPLLTFVSIASLVMLRGFRPLPVILLLFLVEIVGCLIMFAFYNLMVGTFGRVSPLPYAKKVSRFFSRVNPQASSGEYLPKVVGLCTGRLGVSERVASFSAALGASVNMDGSAIHMVVCSVLMAKLFGVTLTPQIMVLIGITAFLLSGGAAAVQNSGMLSVSSLAVMLGIPTAGIALLFGVDQILDLTRTASNAVGDVAVCVIVANRDCELDKDTYFGE